MQSVYIAGAGAGSGKSVVVLGFMEMLTAANRKVGFFRPLLPQVGRSDNIMELVCSRYELAHPPEMMYGCTVATTRQLLGSGRYDDLLKLIMNKFKMLEEQCDLVVCAGTDFQGVVPSVEFGLNADLAKNLGCRMVAVAGAFERSPREALDTLHIARELMRERGSDFLASIVNGLAEEHCEQVRAEATKVLGSDEAFYILPARPSLRMPSIAEVAKTLDAELIYGGEEALNQTVSNYKIAAMEVGNFLDHVEDGCMIIVPGDRSDIILASLGADASPAFPRVSGMLLTGGLRPAENVQRLIDGLHGSKVPMLLVPEDTFAAAMRVKHVESTILPGDSRKIAAALGLFESQVDMPYLRERMAVRHGQRVTPLIFEYELIRRAKAARKHIVLPEGVDKRVLQAAEILMLRQVVDLTLLGDPERVGRRLSELGIRLDGVRIVDPASAPARERYADLYCELRRHKGVTREMAFDVLEDVSYFGTLMVYAGDADGMVSGAAHTTQHTIRPAFETIKTQPDVQLVSSVFLMCLPDRVLVYGDCAVNSNPTAEDLADIAISSAATAQAFGVEPRIAMLSYSSGSSGKGADVEKVRAATQLVRERRPDLLVDGPIQYDAAVDPEIGRSKLPDSAVAGHATVLIFPDLNTGNNTYKAVQRSAGAVAIGPVLQGLNKPVNDLSRGCTVTDIVNTVAITAIQAQTQNPPDAGPAAPVTV